MHIIQDACCTTRVALRWLTAPLTVSHWKRLAFPPLGRMALNRRRFGRLVVVFVSDYHEEEEVDEWSNTQTSATEQSIISSCSYYMLSIISIISIVNIIYASYYLQFVCLWRGGDKIAMINGSPRHYDLAGRQQIWQIGNVYICILRKHCVHLHADSHQSRLPANGSRLTATESLEFQHGCCWLIVRVVSCCLWWLHLLFRCATTTRRRHTMPTHFGPTHTHTPLNTLLQISMPLRIKFVSD